MEKWEVGLWAADFVIGGVGYWFGGPYGAILCFSVAGALLLWVLLKEDKKEKKEVQSVLVDTASRPVRAVYRRQWHKPAALVATVIAIGSLIFGAIRYRDPFKNVLSDSKLSPQPPATSLKDQIPAETLKTLQPQLKLPRVQHPAQAAKKNGPTQAARENKSLPPEQGAPVPSTVAESYGTTDEISVAVHHPTQDAVTAKVNHGRSQSSPKEQPASGSQQPTQAAETAVIPPNTAINATTDALQSPVATPEQPTSLTRAEPSDEILEELKGVLEKDRDLRKMEGCPTGKSIGLRMIGDSISYYVCLKQCFAFWETIKVKRLDFSGMRIYPLDGEPTLASVSIPCLPQTPTTTDYGLCVMDQRGTFTTSTACHKKNVKTDFYSHLDIVVHVENADSVERLWKKFGAESKPPSQ